MNTFLRIKLAIFTLLFLPSSAAAVVPDAFREYITYGNFNQVSNSFQRLALVMSDDGMGFYFLIAFLLSVFVWAAIALFRFITGTPISGAIAQGLVFILIGSFIVFAFVIPKGNMAVYDEVSNRHVVVGDVPDGVVLISGAQNMFVNSVIDIIWTSTDPLSYRQNAGGDIFNILQNVFDVKPFLPSTDDSSGEYLNKSVAKYWEDCSEFAMYSSGGSFDINNLQSGMTVMEMLQTLSSNTIFTTYYDQANPAGVGQSCAVALQNIEGELNGLTDEFTGEKFWRERCGDSGYYDQTGTLGESAYEICEQKVVDFLLLEASSVSGIGIVREMVVASALYNYIKNYDIAGLSDFKINTALRGEGATASSWLPIIKGSVFSIFIGIIPFLLILFPTSLFPKVASFILGIFVFMVSWEVCDAIIHSYAMDQAMAIVDDVLDDKLSLYDIWMMQGEAIKSLLLFGKMRWASMMLSAVIATGIGVSSGYAMAHFAGMMNFSGQGDQGAKEILDPDARSRDLNVLPNAVPTEAVTNEYGFAGMQGAGYMGQRGGMEASQMIMGSAGGPHGGSQQSAGISHDNHVASTAHVNARGDIAEQTGITPYEQSRVSSKDGSLRSVGQGLVTDDMNQGDVLSMHAISASNQAASVITQNYAHDIMNHGGPSAETVRAKDDFIDAGYGGMTSREAMVAFNTSATAQQVTMTDDQKANYVDWHNGVTGDNLTTSDVSSTGSFVYGLNSNGDLEPRFMSTQEGHTNSVYANTTENVGSDYNASVADDLGNNNFVNSNVDVLGHKDVVIGQASNAIGTFVSQGQYANVSLSGNANVNAGLGGPGIGAGVGAHAGVSQTGAINENQIASELREKLDGVTSNTEARQVIQSTYNDYVQYSSDNFNVPTTRDVGNTVDNIMTDPADGRTSREQRIIERH